MAVTVCGITKPDPKSALKAIRMKCLDCSAGNSNEVKLCPIKDCPLYKYRLGKNPYRKSKTEKQINAARESMLNFHRNKKSDVKLP